MSHRPPDRVHHLPSRTPSVTPACRGRTPSAPVPSSLAHVLSPHRRWSTTSSSSPRAGGRFRSTSSPTTRAAWARRRLSGVRRQPRWGSREVHLHGSRRLQRQRHLLLHGHERLRRPWDRHGHDRCQSPADGQPGPCLNGEEPRRHRASAWQRHRSRPPPNGALTVVLVPGSASHGKVKLVDGAVEFDPDRRFSGDGSFQYYRAGFRRPREQSGDRHHQGRRQRRRWRATSL